MLLMEDKEGMARGWRIERERKCRYLCIYVCVSVCV
jgi:hypothetical protein